ncbi:TPA: hypothetical protein ACP02Z_001763, partial [Streptococcus pyogenes]
AQEPAMTLWGWTEIKKIETRTSLHQNKSKAGYRSSVIIQGVANALTRHRAPVSKNKGKRGLFSTKKDVHANAFMIKYPTILYHEWRVRWATFRQQKLIIFWKN